MMDRPRSDPGASGALGKLAGFVITVVMLAGIYVGYQALQVLFPPNTYETALLATVADTVDADGVLLFDEVYVPGGGTLGYLAADGERVSAGAAVAEIYSSPEQAGLLGPPSWACTCADCSVREAIWAEKSETSPVMTQSLF